MINKVFDGKALSSLVAAMGFNQTGVPHKAAQFVHKLLSLAPLYEEANQEALKALLPRKLYYAVLYAFTTHRVMEHGGNVGGSWLAGKGHDLLEELDRINWDLPHKPTMLAFPTQKFQPRRAANFDDPNDVVSICLDHCGCGCPDEALDFTIELLGLAPLKMDDAALTALVPDEGTRQFLIYHMTYLGLVDEATGALTSEGVQILPKLVEVVASLEETESDEPDSHDDD